MICLPIQAMASYSFTWTDDFSSGINPLWWITNADSTSSVVASGGKVVMTQGTGANNSWDNYLKTTYSVTGDFMISIDYSLSNWPTPYNLERVGLSTQYGTSAAGTVERFSDTYVNSPGDGYLVDWGPGTLYGATATTDTSGTLKIERIGNTVSFYQCQGATCTQVGPSQTATGSGFDSAHFGIWKFQTEAGGVVVAFDNFTLSANSDPRPVPIPATLLLLGSGLLGMAGIRKLRK
jgi:hypothetical protein